jgi:4-hydroxymandelate oxidase
MGTLLLSLPEQYNDLYATTMPDYENKWRRSLTRRNAIGGLAGFLAGSPLRGQQDPFRDHSRVPGLDELVTAFDFEPVAYAKVPREAYDYTALGVEGEFTLRRNREAFDWVGLVPRAITNVSAVNTSTEVLGIKMNYPMMLAPTAGHMQLHPDGELATHEGATRAAGTPMIVSNNASYPMDKIAATGDGPMWFQLYARDSPDANRDVVERAVAAGCRAVVLTADVQMYSHRERALHNRNLTRSLVQRRPRQRQDAKPDPLAKYKITGQTPFIDWTIFDQLRAITKVPLLVKGILTAEDALIAVERGLDGIVVSNHGGRYLDYAPSSLEVLPEIADAVKGRVPILIDGGFRRGSDVVKALALGANAVCFGRVPRWGLGAYGSPGVQRVLEILQKELVATMTAIGRPTLASLDRSAVRTDFA